jgi:hypothetical protein
MKWYKAGKINHANNKQDFVFILACVLVVSFFTLLVLSLRIATDKISSGYWTFLQDARYYGLAIVLIQMGYFLMIHHWRPHNLLRKSLFGILFILLVIEMLRGLGFVSNRIFNFNKEEYSWQYDIRFQKFAADLIEQEKKSSGVQHVVLTGSEFLNNRITLENKVPRMYTDTLINNISFLHTKKTVMLFVVIQDIARERFAAFLNNIEVKEVGRFDNYSFYTIYIKPTDL